MEKCRAWRGHSLCQRIGQWKSSRIRQQFYRSESFAMNTDTFTSGSTVKNHISFKTVFGYNATRRTSFRSWFQACQRVLPPTFLLQHQWHLQDRRLIILHFPQARLLHQPQLCQATVRLEYGNIWVKIDSHPISVSSEQLNGKNGETPLPSQPKIQNQIQTKMRMNGETRMGRIIIPQSCQVKVWKGKNGETSHSEIRNGCKNSENISWMIEFLNEETHTPILLMNRRWSLRLREVRIWVNTVFILTSLKTEIARSVAGPDLQEPRAEDALAEPYFVQKILVTSLQQITKFSVKVVNLETIIDMQSWCRTWPPNGSSRIRAKQKLLRKHKGACKSSWSRTGSLKSFTLTIPWNLANPVKIFPGIIVRRHHTDRKQMGLLKERCAEWKKVPLPYCCNQVWTMNGGQILSNVTPICETFKISCLMGRRSMKDALENHLKDLIIPFGSLVEYYPISAKDQSRIHQFGEKVLPGLFHGYGL